MLIQVLLLIAGLVLLIKGADWLVSGASSLARKYGVPDLAIGLTIVAFGTSAPELVVNGFAAAQGHYSIVFGNIIGSNNFNLFIILGITGLMGPLVVQSDTVWKEIPLSLLAVVLLFVFANETLVSDQMVVARWEGVLLLTMFALFLFYVYRQLKRDKPKVVSGQKRMSNMKIWLFVGIGLAGLVFGGRLVVDNAVKIATALGVSDKMVGLTIIAAGTSLPELATSMVAAMKKNTDIAVGNIIGSNVFNLFLILGVSSLVNPLRFQAEFNTDIYILGAGTLFLFVAMFTGQKKKLDRWEAAVFVVFYVGYTVLMVSREM